MHPRSSRTTRPTGTRDDHARHRNVRAGRQRGPRARRRLLGERDLSREGRRHARTLISELRDLLNEASLSPADVNTIAVSIGPGSFTGLRVGVACAKTWAYATGANVVGVETFLAVASQSQWKNSPSTTQRVQVISDAQRGELFVGRFQHEADGSWMRQGEIAITPIEEWIASLSPDAIVSGPGVVKLHDRLTGRCQMEAAGRLLPSATSVARLGEQLAANRETSDLWQLEPLYLRRSAAEDKLSP